MYREVFLLVWMGGRVNLWGFPSLFLSLLVLPSL